MDFIKKLINNMSKWDKIATIITFVFFLISLIFFHPIITYCAANFLIDLLFGPTYRQKEWYTNLMLANSVICAILLIIGLLAIIF
jgi:hypothetical protein